MARVPFTAVVVRIRNAAIPAAVMLCLAGAAAAQDQAQALTGAEIRALIVGNTVIGPIGRRQYDFSYQPDGVVYGDIGVSGDTGSWEVSDDGIYCHEWAQHFDGDRRCYRWVPARRGRYRMVNVDRFRTRSIDVWRIKPGLQ